MAKNLWLERFDASKEFVARRTMGNLAPGDVIVKKNFTERRLRQLYDSRVIVHADAWESHVTPLPAVDPVVETVTLPAVDPVVETVTLPFLPGVEAATHDALPVAIPAPDSDGPPDEKETLLADAKDLGIKVDGRWSTERLKSEIDKALDNGESA